MGQRTRAGVGTRRRATSQLTIHGTRPRGAALGRPQRHKDVGAVGKLSCGSSSRWRSRAPAVPSGGQCHSSSQCPPSKWAGGRQHQGPLGGGGGESGDGVGQREYTAGGPQRAWPRAPNVSLKQLRMGALTVLVPTAIQDRHAGRGGQKGGHQGVRWVQQEAWAVESHVQDTPVGAAEAPSADGRPLLAGA